MSHAPPPSDTDPFLFVDDPATYRPDGVLVVRVPAKAKGKEKLLGLLADKLRFPRYFGRNWDALEECLGDLSWLVGIGRVAIVHEGLPLAVGGPHLATYLAVLRSAVERRRAASAGPQLDIVFSKRQQDNVNHGSRGGPPMPEETNRG